MEEQDTLTAPEPAVELPAEPVEQPKPAPKPDRGGFFWGTGRRKSSVARVRVRPGDGKFEINGRGIDQFFTELRDRNDIVSPLQVTKTEGQIDVFVNVNGGGYTGQSGAIMLGLSRALMKYDTSLEAHLREQRLLTRDPREVERKKPGQPKARKRFQFSKR
jgi:small subunit ribosomal protein S9